MSQCRSCGATIVWVQKLVPNNRPHPLDPEPSTNGNVRMLGIKNAVARVLNKSELADARTAGEKLYTSHFATCPNAKKHRTTREKR